MHATSTQEINPGGVPSGAPATVAGALELGDVRAVRVVGSTADSSQGLDSLTLTAFLYLSALGEWVRAPSMDVEFPDPVGKGGAADVEVRIPAPGAWLAYVPTAGVFGGTGSGDTADKVVVLLQGESVFSPR